MNSRAVFSTLFNIYDENVLAKLVNGFQPLTFLAKSFITDV